MKTKNFKFKSMALVLFALVLSSNVWGATVTETLTKTKITSNVTNSTCAYATEKTYTDGNVSYSFYVYTDANNRPWMQLKKDKGVYIKISTPDPITQVDVTITSATNSSGGITDITKHTAYSGRLALLAADAAGAADMTGVAYTNEITNNVMTLTPTGSNTELYLKVSAGARVWQIAVTHGSSCTKKITITKGTETNGTFNLSQTGEVCIDEGDATVDVTDIQPAEHYHFSQITATNGTVDNVNKKVTDISANTTINVEFAEDTKHTISFLDNIQLEDVASKEVYDGATFEFPVLTDKTATTEGTCEDVHYHFMGWVISTHTGEITVGDIKTGTSDAVNANATYKAVWAAEQQ